MPLFGPPNAEKLKARRDIAGLVKALAYRKDEGVRKAAAEALGEIGDARAVEPLIAALKSRQSWVGGDAAVRGDAARLLVNIGAPAVEPLSAALGDRDPDMRMTAAEALGKIGWKPKTSEAKALYADEPQEHDRPGPGRRDPRVVAAQGADGERG